jgi:hypothetical protein
VLYLAGIIKENRSALPQPPGPEFPVGRERNDTHQRAINGETYAPPLFSLFILKKMLWENRWLTNYMKII